MIYELRTYTLTFGGIPRYLALYETKGMLLQRRHLGEPLGYFVSEVGALNQIIHLWAYKSFEDRMSRRTGLLAEEGWRAFLQELAPLMIRQENSIMLAAPFWARADKASTDQPKMDALPARKHAERGI